MPKQQPHDHLLVRKQTRSPRWKANTPVKATEANFEAADINILPTSGAPSAPHPVTSSVPNDPTLAQHGGQQVLQQGGGGRLLPHVPKRYVVPRVSAKDFERGQRVSFVEDENNAVTHLGGLVR